MKKIPTILPKNKDNLGLVTDGKVLDGISYFKLKIDGTSCLIKDGKPYCRYDAKLFKRKNGKIIQFSIEEVSSKLPEGAIPCQEPDTKSGHWPHWVPVLDSPEHQYILEGFNNLEIIIDGTYECIGPKLQGNPHDEDCHLWIPHFHENLTLDINGWENDPFTFFKDFFQHFEWEGLVAYNDSNEAIGKIRRSDYGYLSSSYKKASKLIS